MVYIHYMLYVASDYLQHPPPPPPHLLLSPASLAGFAPSVLALDRDLPNTNKACHLHLALPCHCPGTKPFSSRSFATPKMQPIAIILLIITITPTMSIIPTYT